MARTLVIKTIRAAGRTFEVNEELEVRKRSAIIRGWWSSDPQGDEVIERGRLEETVYFHVETRDLKPGDKIKMQLFDYDNLLGADKLNRDDKEFPDKEIIENRTVQNMYREVFTIKLYLDPEWEKMVADDSLSKLELYWRVETKDERKDLPESKSNYLDVFFPERSLYVVPPINGYGLPEILTQNGHPVVFVETTSMPTANNDTDLLASVGESAALSKLSEAGEEWRKEGADAMARKYALMKLEKGKIVTNIGEIYNRKNSIYTYNELYTNDGTLLQDVKQSKNFGFKHYKVADGKTVTSKGISQIDYFSKTGFKGNLIQLSKGIGFGIDTYLDVVSAATGKSGSVVVPGAWAPVTMVAEIVVSQKKAEMDADIEASFKKELEIAKQKGLSAVRAFVNSGAGKTLKYQLIPVSSSTVDKTLKGEFKFIGDLELFNIENADPFAKSQYVILYRTINNKNRNEEITLIETIFISQ